MDELWQWLDVKAAGWSALRLGLAAVLGGCVGIEREWVGKDAGLRTHMLVSLGAALFVVVALESGVGPDGVARVIQGVATGIGFIGAGTILKRADRDEVSGLTSAAAIWVTGAIGVAAGAGALGVALLCVVSAWVILWLMWAVNRWMSRWRGASR
jgi:putative Mg2+ transporter-C (MgtC) family protein